jgi:hypothetical protein
MSGRSYDKAEAVVDAAEADPEKFGDLVEQMDETGKVDGAYKELQRRRAQQYQQSLKAPVADTDDIRVGDFRAVLGDLPDGSVDLIFTDPPYGKDSIPLYRDLAGLAERVLCDGGSLVCYAGQYALFDIGPLMTGMPGLRYRWLIMVRHAGGHRRQHGWRVRVGGKPLLWFVKGEYLGEYLSDQLDSRPGDKRAHEWAQGEAEARYLIERLAPPGGLVLDPMCGSGTTLIAARRLGRRFLGVEVDEARAGVAAGRLRADPAVESYRYDSIPDLESTPCSSWNTAPMKDTTCG